jgi:hypothetical protein
VVVFVEEVVGDNVGENLLHPQMTKSGKTIAKKENLFFFTAKFYKTNAQRFALPALGRTAERRPARKRLRRGKGLELPQNPQRRVHALLGVCGFSQNLCLKTET